jgi:hypothetical protein
MEEHNDTSKARKFFMEFWLTVRYPLLYAGITFFVTMIFIVILSIVDETGGGGGVPPEDRVDEMLAMLISASLAFLLIWRFVGKEWQSTGFWQHRNLAPVVILVCVLLGVTLNIFVNGFLYLLVDAATEPGSESLILEELGNPIIIFIASNLAIPLIEEVLFRGIVLERFRKTKLNVKAALIIQALIFAAFHTGGVQITYTFALGIILGLIYLWSGSVWAPLAVHVVFNTMTDVLAAFFDIGSSGVPGPVWALCALAGLAASVFLLRYLKRRRVAVAEG